MFRNLELKYERGYETITTRANDQLTRTLIKFTFAKSVPTTRLHLSNFSKLDASIFRFTVKSLIKVAYVVKFRFDNASGLRTHLFIELSKKDYE